MEVRRIILPAVAALLLVFVVVLYVKVTGSNAASVDPEALERAKSEHSRAERRASASPPPPEPSRSTTTRVRPPPKKEEPAPEPEEITPPPPQPRRIMPGTRSLRARDADEGAPNELRDQLKAVRKMYDRGRYPEAREAALELLEEHPSNRRMLRVVVSASCIMFEPEPAKQYYPKLPERDKRTMRKRCAKYGIEDLED